MTWGMHAVALIETDGPHSAEVSSNFNRSFSNAQHPFLVWTETPTGGTTNFLTGVGGFLQTVLFGLPGLRVWSDRLAIHPQLVEGMTSVKARGVHYQGRVFDLSFDATEMSIELKSGGTLSVTDAEGAVFAVAVGKKATLPAGEAAIRPVKGQ